MGQQGVATTEEYPCLLKQGDGTLLLKLHVQPRAGKNEIAGLHDGSLKLRLTTPPVDGKANKAVLAFLAGLFGISKSALILKSGQKNRAKTIIMQGVSEEDARAVLFAHLPDKDRAGNTKR